MNGGFQSRSNVFVYDLLAFCATLLASNIVEERRRLYGRSYAKFVHLHVAVKAYLGTFGRDSQRRRQLECRPLRLPWIIWRFMRCWFHPQFGRGAMYVVMFNSVEEDRAAVDDGCDRSYAFPG